MTQEHKKIEEEVEKTLHAFDKDVIPEANPYLFTRIQTVRAGGSGKSKKSFSFRMGLNHVILLAIIVLNAVTIVFYFQKDAKQDVRQKLVMELKSDFQLDQSQSNF